MQVRNTPPENDVKIPEPDAFRAWVQASLTALFMSAAALSKAAGMSRNSLGAFLAQPGRGITLANAHEITCKLQEAARAQGVDLPALPGRELRNV